MYFNFKSSYLTLCILAYVDFSQNFSYNSIWRMKNDGVNYHFCESYDAHIEYDKVR